ncbi:hypothetical protein PAN31117_05059 [Pandoraea anapnoica]|uniref:Uncharacterized protein n=1 Tax=Pandoraea anapnoica TaxID=2508301 RepID=A0A5E5AQD1_9BURK|nr:MULTISPECIES: hypothetical protein [Pandoraea]VVE58657.1 hypothetical protein PIN31009_05341 [Pandoraea iniqua]VVE75012.1 hypothetical protein PAN31117_05059 [Pandoraea anapnoica]
MKSITDFKDQVNTKTARLWRLSIATVSILPFIWLAACSDRTLDFRNAEIVNGKAYAVGANKPFTGKLTNIPENALLLKQDGFVKAARVTGMTLAGNMGGAQSVMFDSLCDAQVSDGMLDGKFVCKAPQSETVMIESSFNRGALDGKLTLNGGPGNGPLTEVKFDNGLPNGTQKIYGWSTHKLVHTYPWVSGVLSGTEEGFDANSGELIKRVSIVNGQYEGELVQYTPDGKQMILRATYVGGRLNGPFKSWDATGSLTGETLYANGIEVGTDGKSVDDCVREWDEADQSIQTSKQMAKGILTGTTPATEEQKDSWRSNCRAGNHPNPTEQSQARQAYEHASAAIDDCIANKKAMLRRNSGMPDNLAIMDSQIIEMRNACYREVGHTASARSSTIASSGLPKASSAEDACVAAWTAAYRREKGGDALVSMDQLNEWEAWCKSGKRPS